MNKYTILTVLLIVATSFLSTTLLASKLDYQFPIRGADKDEVKQLPGLDDPINFRQYSGYLSGNEPNEKAEKFLHYWFVESQSNSTKDPLVLWLNGGPGCSSLGGLFTELGPFSVNDDLKTLKLNDYSWNKVANVLFLESPAGVGFSYTTIDYSPNDDSTARENYNALRSFIKKFPQYEGRPLFISGESYAGVYLPTLGVLLDADEKFNFQGVAIGNGYLDSNKLSDSLVLFAYHHGIIGKTLWDELSQKCCQGQYPSRENCDFSSSALIDCPDVIIKIEGTINYSGIDPYNMYADCSSNSLSKTRFAKREMSARKLRSRLIDGKFAPVEKFKDEPPCVDDGNLIGYLNTHKVREAIHIPGEVPAWDTCTELDYYMQYPGLDGGLRPQIMSLIESKRNLTMLIYNGDVDTVCNFLGDEWFVDDLGRKVVKDYSIWKADNQVAGWVKHFDGITFATVRGSGHMVPGDRPVEALEMFKKFISAKAKGNVIL